MKGLRRTLSVALLIAAASGAARAEMPATMAATPEEVGLSSAQLKRLEAVTKGHVDSGLLPGAVMLVARRGKIAWTSVQGKQDVAQPEPMKFDSLFRIYSMTKPIVSVALMQMVEEGKLQVYDPVAKYLPELGNMKVGTEKLVEGRMVLEYADPKRPMTVQDLLRHTAGLTYGARGVGLIHQAYVEAKIGNRGFTNQEFVTNLSKMALKFSPGERWEYSVAVDVQGRLLEVLSGGKKLSEVLSERIFQPLAMVDTAFQVPEAKLSRVAQPGPRLNNQPMTPRFKVDDGAKYESGGGGLVGTMEDYLRFSMMLANGGQLQGKRILGKKTIEFMTADHIGDRAGRPPGLGFGLGFEVRTRPGDAGMPGSVGEYGWSGAAGTTFWIDPKEQLIAIYMVQVSTEDRIYLRNQFRTMVQASIID
jgi:CubicO group peptidase (beta-lactamase class C family)